MLPEKLTESQVKEYKENGYLHFKNVISQELLQKCREAYERMRIKCESYEYDRMRHEYLIDEQEFRGIEHIFAEEIFEEDMLKALMEARILEYSKQLLATDDVSMILNRLHCTKYYGLSGFWHRDGLRNENEHVQSSLHFYNEAGFYVVPNSHKTTDPEDALNRDHGGTRDVIEGMKVLPVEAGDMLLFDSAIFHRGQCPGRKKYSRAHIHIRIGRDEAIKNLPIFREEHWNNDKVLSTANDDWKELFTKKRPEPKLYWEPKTRNRDNGLKAKLRRMKNKTTYHLSRFLGPENKLISKSNRIIPYPYVKIPKGYEEFLEKNR